MMIKRKCTAIGCKDGKVTLFVGFADCKDCNGTGETWEYPSQGSTQVEPTCTPSVNYNGNFISIDADGSGTSVPYIGTNFIW